MSIYIRKSGFRERVNIDVAIGASMEVLVSADEAPNFAMRRFVIAAGGSIPEHTNTVEHEQYVLRGSAEVSVGGEIFTASAGDAIFIPAGVPHWYRAGDDEDYEFICVVPNQEDKMMLVD